MDTIQIDGMQLKTSYTNTAISALQDYLEYHPGAKVSLISTEVRSRHVRDLYQLWNYRMNLPQMQCLLPYNGLEAMVDALEKLYISDQEFLYGLVEDTRFVIGIDLSRKNLLFVGHLNTMQVFGITKPSSSKKYRFWQ